MALGYTDDMGRAGVLPDEFIWAEFVKDNSDRSAACLQANIIEYLNKYSDTFRREYGHKYTEWHGICTSDKLRDSADCIDCRMHPRKRKKQK